MSDADQAPLPRRDIERAEQLVDVMGQSAGDLAARLSRGLLRGIALAREEAEDILAEAQAVSHEDPEPRS